MQHPYQCGLYFPATGARDGHDDLIITACGPRLLSFNANSKALVSHWGSDQIHDHDTAAATTEDDAERPAKRQKNGDSTLHKGANVIKLTASVNNQYVVAVTDDKNVRVFEVLDDGRLAAKSQRCMPKRPCAIEVLSDNTTILCGDKFGDVYSLPLVPDDEDVNPSDEATPDRPAPSDFKPTATHLTVHTKRNRMALEAQMKQKDLTPRKDAAKFKHHLLLGHVSMLTDMTSASTEVEGKMRSLIITADRDEHIRISRAPPQAHVIEGYCLGHTQFVSKLCLIPQSQWLVSGGGDDWLGLWDWANFRLVQRLPLREAVISLAEIDPAYGSTSFPIAVSGLWAVPGTNHAAANEAIVVVALERVPALLIYTVPLDTQKSASTANTPVSVVSCPGAPLEVFQLGQRTVVSLDQREQGRARLCELSIQSNEDTMTAQLADGAETVLVAINAYQPPINECTSQALDDLLYGVGNLRKRGTAEADGDADESGEAA